MLLAVAVVNTADKAQVNWSHSHSIDQRCRLQAFIGPAAHRRPRHSCIGGGLLYKEGKYEEARQSFIQAINKTGLQPELAYNVALCHYQLKQYGLALKQVAAIIEKGVREHPELGIGANTDGLNVRSVGNSQVATCSCLTHCSAHVAASVVHISHV